MTKADQTTQPRRYNAWQFIHTRISAGQAQTHFGSVRDFSLSHNATARNSTDSMSGRS